MTFAPSAYQAAIFDFIVNGSGDGLVSAVAGSGKTTTLIEAAALLRTTSALFVAFNVHIKDELNARFAAKNVAMRAVTVHGFGYRAVNRAFGGPGKKLTVAEGLPGKKDKYPELCDLYVDYTAEPELRVMLDGTNKEIAAQARELLRLRAKALCKLVNMVRLTRTLTTDRDAVVALAAQYDIATDSEAGDRQMFGGVRRMLDEGVKLARRGIIDYTDMIWLPVALSLPVDKYDWIFADECQDLSNCARELLLMARGEGGRYLLVGDPFQAIMGFAGANANSFNQIKIDTNATELPLSVCYRCPRSHLEIARVFVENIEDAPRAKDGRLAALKESAAVQAIGEGALVLCRMTAPLVKLCIELIKGGKPARVRGRDIAKMLIELAKTIGKGMDLYGTTFGEELGKYEQSQIERIGESENSAARIEAVTDKCSALRACYEGMRTGSSVADLCAYIDSIFQDKKSSIWLSTVHRAKGLEAADVFLLYPDLLPLTRPGQTEEDMQQEDNIAYVALTRSTDRLSFIVREDKTPSRDWIANLNV